MNTSFERTKSHDEWLTPPEILKPLGLFDLDPCAPIIRPWPTAKLHYTIEDNGLLQEWHGRVYCKPPYGNKTGQWLARMAAHNNGIALIFARTETQNFFKYIWPIASAIMFLKGRLIFYNVDGTRPKNSAGAPSCLVAYGRENAEILKANGLNGKFIYLSNLNPGIDESTEFTILS